MSIRTNPMKAVPVLLKRVKTARNKFHQSGRDESLDAKLEKLTRDLNKIEDVFMKVKKNQDELVDTLHEVDDHLRKLDGKRLDQDMDHFCKRIRDCAHKLFPMEAFEEDHNTETVQSHPSSSQHKKEFGLYKHVDLTMDMLDRLKSPLRYCLSTLSIFPKDAIINKRHIIYWWIGEGELQSTTAKTAEEVGEHMIDEHMSRYSDILIKLPLSLEKLHLECFPGPIIPDWLAYMLNIWKFPVLKELNITGGKLENMNTKHFNSVEIVRLMYLEHLQVDLTNLKKNVSYMMKYVEIKQSETFLTMNGVGNGERCKSKSI